MEPVHLPSAAGIIFDSRRRLLMIRRGRAPSVGTWSLPGGKSLPGESSRQTCVREVREETGLTVEVLRLAGQVTVPGPREVVFDITDFVCAEISGTLRAGDDASDARWVTLAEMDGLELAPGLRAALTDWQLLPD